MVRGPEPAPRPYFTHVCSNTSKHMQNALLEFVFNAAPRKQGKCSHAGKDEPIFIFLAAEKTCINPQGTLVHVWSDFMIRRFLMATFSGRSQVGLMVLTPGLCAQSVRHSYWILLNPLRHYSVSLLSGKTSVGVCFLHWAVNSNNGEKTSRFAAEEAAEQLLQFT